MLSNPRNIKSRSRFSRNIIRDIDKALPNSSYASTEKNKQSLKQESNDKKDKAETVKDNDNAKDSGTVKKTTKTDDKNACKNNEESSKKGEKKKNTNSNSSLRNRGSVKSDAKTKKELKETLKIEDNIVDKLCVDENSTDKKVEKKKYARNLFGKSMRKPTKKEKIVKVKSTETGLPSARKKRSIKEQIKTFVKVITPFKKSKRGTSNIQMETLTKIKPDDDIPKVIYAHTHI